MQVTLLVVGRAGVGGVPIDIGLSLLCICHIVLIQRPFVFVIFISNECYLGPILKQKEDEFETPRLTARPDDLPRPSRRSRSNRGALKDFCCRSVFLSSLISLFYFVCFIFSPVFFTDVLLFLMFFFFFGM